MSNRPIQIGDMVWLPTPLRDRAELTDTAATRVYVTPGLRDQALALEAQITAEPGRVASIDETGWAMVDRGSWGQFGHRVEDLRRVGVCAECKVDLSQVDEHDEGCSVGALEHCSHRVRTYDERDEMHDPAEDYCVHCDCCCTCLGCEYGPRDGLIASESATPEQSAALAALRDGSDA